MFQLSGPLRTHAAVQHDRGWSRTRTWAALFIGSSLVPACGPEFLFAQSTNASALDRIRDENGFPFHIPATSPLEPVHRIAIAVVDRDTTQRTIALAELGDRLAFWIVQAPNSDFELAGAFQGGVSSRFDLTQPRLDFMEIHYRAGFLLRARFGAVAARAELYHVSSHLGDEFMVRHELEPISTSREGVEILLQVSPLPCMRLYGGPALLIKSSSDFSTLSLRAGGDWESSGDGFFRGYAAVNVFSWSELDWRPRIAVEAGTALGQHARIGFMLGVGPSRAEQFFRDDETLFGISAYYVR